MGYKSDIEIAQECEMLPITQIAEKAGIDRDSTADSDLYRYTASGKAYYQTDKTNAATKTPVPEGSVVLLYKVVDGQESAQYVVMTTTKADGSYSFEKLSDGTTW